MFQQQYVQFLDSLKGQLNRLDTEQFTALTGLEVARPEWYDASRWETLTDPQRMRILLSARRHAAAGGEFTVGRDDGSLCALAFPALQQPAEVARIAGVLLRNSEYKTQNPSIGALVQYIDNTLLAGEPISLWTSYCLKKKPEVRPAKLEWFVNRRLSGLALPSFTEGVEAKTAESRGWDRLRAITGSIGAEVRLTVLLGDQDLWTLDGGSVYVQGASAARYRREMEELRAVTQQEADGYFGPGRAQVRLWSELYDLEQFEREFAIAGDLERWENLQTLSKRAETLYLDQWGYRSIARSRGWSMDQIREFISGDVVRTAAQYSLEAKIVQEQRGVQVWAERVPMWRWPFDISHYDGKETTPTLFLLP